VARCPYRCKNPTNPPMSMPLETVREHPSYKHLLEPGAQCEKEEGHGQDAPEHDEARRHGNGGLLWWDPPIVVVGSSGDATRRA
jgi:hypothetical protein